MNDQEGDNSASDHNYEAPLSSLRTVLARPTFQWVIINDDGEQSLLNNEIDDASDSDSIALTDSDCIVIKGPKKRKLQDVEATATPSTSAGQGKILIKKQRLPNDQKCSSTASDGMKTEEKNMWHKLPQPLIVCVMSYLNYQSRLNMALSCKEWAKLIHSACLWRNLSVELSAFRSIDKPIINYTKRHARHINNVVITWRRPSYIISTKIHNGLTKILSHLKDHSQVNVFRMHYMELDRYWRFESRREKLLTSISKFLEVQTKLKVFVMNSAQTGISQGCRILESAAKQSGESIQTLNIEDFFQARVAAFRVEQYYSTIVKFTNIKYLYLNYNCLSDDIMESFASNCKLETLSVKVYKNDPHFHRISQATWRKLKNSCPKLEVNFEFDQIPSYTDIVPILVPPIPLRALYIWSGYMEEDDWRVGDTLNHLSSNFSKSLATFTLEIENDLELIDGPLLRMVEACKSLYHLDVNAVMSTTTVNEICQLQEKGKISLQSLYITIAGVTENDTQELLDEIMIKYAEVIEAYNLDFQFTADLISVSEVNYVPIEVVQRPNVIIEP